MNLENKIDAILEHLDIRLCDNCHKKLERIEIVSYGCSPFGIGGSNSKHTRISYECYKCKK